MPLAGFVSYIWDMTRGRAEPNRVSWALWASAPLIAFPAELAQHARLQAAFVMLAPGTGPLAVLLISLTRPECYWKVTRFGYACGGLSAAALELWLIARRGDVAIALAIAADGFAAVPTVGKSWSHPRSESPWTYLASGAGSVITLLTIRDWTSPRAASRRTWASCARSSARSSWRPAAPQAPSCRHEQPAEPGAAHHHPAAVPVADPATAAVPYIAAPVSHRALPQRNLSWPPAHQDASAIFGSEPVSIAEPGPSPATPSPSTTYGG